MQFLVFVFKAKDCAVVELPAFEIEQLDFETLKSTVFIYLTWNDINRTYINISKQFIAVSFLRIQTKF